MIRRIEIRKINIPPKKEFNQDLHWLIKSIGLRSGRDIDNTSFKIFKALVEMSSKSGRVRCEDLAEMLHIKHGRVNHHIRQFIDSGIVVREKAKVTIRGGSLKKSVEEIKKDTDRIFNEMLKIAEELDREAGFENRY